MRISEIVRIGSTIIFHLSKRWRGKFFAVWGNISGEAAGEIIFGTGSRMRTRFLFKTAKVVLPETRTRTGVSVVAIPALVATHTYTPASASVRLVTLREPSVTAVRTAGSCPPSFLQLITGLGSPTALQFTFNVPPVKSSTLAGGFWENLGSPTTTRKVLAATDPRRFDASHT